jgi:hypothetical protein
MPARMIKRFIRTYTAKKVADNYSSYSDFAHNASKKEKEAVIQASIKKANQMQRELVSSH